MVEAQASDWRDVCRGLAQERANAEAIRLWKWNEQAEHVPFSHRREHVQEVVRLALLLAAAEGATPEQTTVIEAAAWLHDIRKHEPHHATAGAAEAPRVLASTDFPPALIDAVAHAIAQHEGLTRPPGAPPLQPLEAAILWDADKLSKLGVSALVSGLLAPYDTGCTLSERRHRHTLWVRSTLARTVESMNTRAAQQAARHRFAAMSSALAAWEAEEAGL